MTSGQTQTMKAPMNGSRLKVASQYTVRTMIRVRLDRGQTSGGMTR